MPSDRWSHHYGRLVIREFLQTGVLKDMSCDDGVGGSSGNGGGLISVVFRRRKVQLLAFFFPYPSPSTKAISPSVPGEFLMAVIWAPICSG
ncbi:hypothetical protein L1049_002119 [Liquidambar formosana]|uniref:Uncharacterized protein n=1 Tax=Liquidambar formosana TaxID=63359 RepID=A0AAP0R974_LIQFO